MMNEMMNKMMTKIMNEMMNKKINNDKTDIYPDIVGLLKEYNIKIKEIKSEDTLANYAKDYNTIVVNKKLHLDAKKFAILHEFGHLYIEDKLFPDPSNVPKDVIEYYMDVFATLNFDKVSIEDLLPNISKDNDIEADKYSEYGRTYNRIVERIKPFDFENKSYDLDNPDQFELETIEQVDCKSEIVKLHNKVQWYFYNKLDNNRVLVYYVLTTSGIISKHAEKFFIMPAEEFENRIFKAKLNKEFNNLNVTPSDSVIELKLTSNSLK